MAWTARSEDEKKEYFDSPEELEKKVSQLAEWVRDSKHMIIFTVSAYFNCTLYCSISSQIIARFNFCG